MNGTVFGNYDALNRSPFQADCAGAGACASITTDKVRNDFFKTILLHLTHLSKTAYPLSAYTNDAIREVIRLAHAERDRKMASLAPGHKELKNMNDETIESMMRLLYSRCYPTMRNVAEIVQLISNDYCNDRDAATTPGCPSTPSSSVSPHQ